MSTHIHKTYTVGKEVNVSSPEGKFILEADEDNNNDYYFIAAGSGITPIKSMIENVLENEPLSRCYVLYGSRNENSIIFKKRFDEIQKKYQGQIEIVHSLSKPLKEKKKGLAGVFSSKKTTWDGEMGRIDKNKIETFLEKHPSTGNDKQYFLCGPGTLIEIAEALLLEKGIDKKSIHREYFVSGDAPGPLSSEEAKAATIVVTLNGETFEYNSDGKLPILEELINQKKNPPYSCTSGACSSCVAKIKEGEASMEVCYALDDDEVENGYILTCQARAKTQKLSIEFE
jgi:ring-1,2-phenylacetyl-CoA epoxidase subunit PaaE